MEPLERDRKTVEAGVCELKDAPHQGVKVAVVSEVRARTWVKHGVEIYAYETHSKRTRSHEY